MSKTTKELLVEALHKVDEAKKDDHGIQDTLTAMLDDIQGNFTRAIESAAADKDRPEDINPADMILVVLGEASSFEKFVSQIAPEFQTFFAYGILASVDAIAKRHDLLLA